MEGKLFSWVFQADRSLLEKSFLFWFSWPSHLSNAPLTDNTRKRLIDLMATGRIYNQNSQTFSPFFFLFLFYWIQFDLCFIPDSDGILNNNNSLSWRKCGSSIEDELIFDAIRKRKLARRRWTIWSLKRGSLFQGRNMTERVYNLFYMGCCLVRCCWHTSHRQ
jgi:hypothetical protein